MMVSQQMSETVSKQPLLPKPEFAVNQDGQTVADALNGFITHASDGLTGGASLDIATAYFNVGGYSLLADSLNKVNYVRLLLGAVPTPPETRRRTLGEPSDPAIVQQATVTEALANLESWLSSDRDMIGFTAAADRKAHRLVKWLRSDKVEVRRLEDRFLHGKAYLLSGDGEHGAPHGIMSGSSNFTHAGLTTNLEFNLGNYQTNVVEGGQKWFDGLWEQATEYDLAKLFEPRFEEHPPHLIYLRMLWERYGTEIQEEAAETSEIGLTNFQTDGLWRAKRILNKRGGVLVADEVGLGKTYLSGELIRETVIDNRQRVLVISPASLRDGTWSTFKNEHNLPMELVSYEDLTNDSRLNQKSSQLKLKQNINDYALVIVDEAHNLRNPDTQRASALRSLLAGVNPKKLMLLTATPVNNSLWDLYYQLKYFIRNDAALADVGIPSLRDHFVEAVALNPDDLTPEHLFDVLDAVAVRRTRPFVKRWYPDDTVTIRGEETNITFPIPKVRKVSYDLDEVLPGFFDRFAKALTPAGRNNASNPDALTLARYSLSEYRKDQQTNKREIQLAGLLKSGMLKRFESSPNAFGKTCERMADNHRAFLSLLNEGLVATGDVLSDWMTTDSDEVDLFLDKHADTSDIIDNYDATRLRTCVEHDLRLLEGFAAEAHQVTHNTDPNLRVLVDEIADINTEAEQEGGNRSTVHNRRKVLIFSYYADTVDWIYKHLENVTNTDPRLENYRSRIARITGGDPTKHKQQVVAGFAPETAASRPGSKDLYDIVVTTDVLSEGMNLQQARHIINYDLPWNPMRLVQRHGRIDRIGSPHSEVFIRCVFPDSRLDDFLNLETRLRDKIKQASASVGVGEILPGQEEHRIDITETRDVIERIRQEESDIFKAGGTGRGVLSGEEYRQELRQAVSERKQDITGLPWGSGSGMRLPSGVAVGEEPGYVFCVRVADWDQPLFRYVRLDQPVVSDTLTCLDYANPPEGWNTPRVLDDDTYRKAFTAWESAREDVIAKWNHMADNVNLEPKIDKALLNAADIVRDYHPRKMTQAEVDQTVDSICGPHPQLTVRKFRTVLRDNKTEPYIQAEAIVNLVRTLGLVPYEPPEKLPPISHEDVQLVCWLALVD